MVDAAIEMHTNGVFHRDIKLKNTLIETGSHVPRARVIDFGCGCLVIKGYYYHYSGMISVFRSCSSLSWQSLKQLLLFNQGFSLSSLYVFFAPFLNISDGLSPSLCPTLCILGTLSKAPPEWFMFKRYEASPTTVWQQGALLYNLLDHDYSFKTSRYLERGIKINLNLSIGKTHTVQFERVN